MCKNFELNILNGRKNGDLFGNYTSFQYNGNAVVDYVISSEKIKEQIPTLEVGELSPLLSDHCPLYFTLELQDCKVSKEKAHIEKDAPKQFIWTQEEKAKFQAELSKLENISKLNDIMAIRDNDPNVIAEDTTKFLIDIAEKADIRVKN